MIRDAAKIIATQWLYIDDLLPKEEDGNEKE
jgi:hypothetical protein